VILDIPEDGAVNINDIELSDCIIIDKSEKITKEQ
jgi:hypothetical protein